MKLLVWLQRLSIVGLLFSVFIVFAFDMLFQGIFLSAALLYSFISLTWVIQAKNSEMSMSRTTSDISLIVLGAIMLMIVITFLFKLTLALNLNLY